MKTWFVIPARCGSKGLPYKNRDLVPRTFSLMSEIGCKDSGVIFTSDDKLLLDKASELNFNCRNRPPRISNDSASMKDVLIDVADFFKLDSKDTLVCLYPTYPQRTKEDIAQFLNFFNKNDLSSALCKKEAKTHPYMCLASNGTHNAKRIFEHELYRRQDYPECFEISHFMVAIKVGELHDVCDQLYNNLTGFYVIDDKIDVDYITDLNRYNSTQG